MYPYCIPLSPHSCNARAIGNSLSHVTPHPITSSSRQLLYFKNGKCTFLPVNTLHFPRTPSSRPCPASRPTLRHFPRDAWTPTARSGGDRHRSEPIRCLQCFQEARRSLDQGAEGRRDGGKRRPIAVVNLNPRIPPRPASSAPGIAIRTELLYFTTCPYTANTSTNTNVMDGLIMRVMSLQALDGPVVQRRCCAGHPEAIPALCHAMPCHAAACLAGLGACPG